MNAWPKVTIGELCYVARGGSPRPINSFLTDDSNGVNWVKIGDATAGDGKFIASTQEKIKPEGMKMSRLVKPGDFLLSNSMSFGRPYIMQTTGCIHDGWLVLRDKSNRFDPDYLYYFLGSDAAYRQFDALAAGSTVRNLNTDLVKTVKVTLPPLEEQRRIVAALDEAFAAIATATANAKKNVANARELFDASVPRIMAGASGDVKGGTLGNIGGRVFTGPFGSLLHKHDYEVGGIPLVNPSHIDNGRIVPSNEKCVGSETAERLSSYRMKVGDVVLGRRGEMGRCAVVTASEQGFLCGTGSFFIRPFGQADPHYLAQLLRSAPYRKKLEALAGGATMPNLSNTALSELWIELPDYPTQQALVREIDGLGVQIDSIVTLTTRKIVELSALKESLLHRAFSGQLTEREPLAA